ncbi:MAG: hypothetical protein WKG01_32580 [Kofleriaceae bacterium]
MTTLPDWLVERAALDEMPPASRERIDRADPRELAERIAAVHAESAAELASYPAGPAVSQLETRIAGERRRRATRRRNRVLGLVGAATAVGALAVVVTLTPGDARAPRDPPVVDIGDGIRAKGAARLRAFRLAGDHVERLERDSVVRAGDLIQLRYNAGGRRYGVIASIDGAGAVTLHHPASEDAPPEATVLAVKPTALPYAYALDDAPGFERFFFLTSDAPIEISPTLDSLRAVARRSDRATASPDLPAGLDQWSLRLRKPNPSAPKTPTP